MIKSESGQTTGVDESDGMLGEKKMEKKMRQEKGEIRKLEK